MACFGDHSSHCFAAMELLHRKMCWFGACDWTWMKFSRSPSAARKGMINHVGYVRQPFHCDKFTKKGSVQIKVVMSHESCILLVKWVTPGFMVPFTMPPFWSNCYLPQRPFRQTLTSTLIQFCNPLLSIFWDKKVLQEGSYAARVTDKGYKVPGKFSICLTVNLGTWSLT